MPLEEGTPSDGLTDGQWLTQAGLDPARVRALRGEGRLVAWLQAAGGCGESEWVGQCAVVTTHDPGVASVEVLEVASGASQETRQRLVDAAVRAAADAGARTVLVPDADDGVQSIDTALC